MKIKKVKVPNKPLLYYQLKNVNKMLISDILAFNIWLS